jgi:HEAT repeat protein
VELGRILGLLMLRVLGLRERRVPLRFVGIALASIVPGSLRVAYERGLDLTVRAGLLRARAVPAVLDVLAAETAASRVTSRSTAVSNGLFFRGHRNVPRLVTALKNSDWSVRTNAAVVLAQLGPQATSAQTVLIETLKDPESRVRSSAAAALDRIRTQ